MDNNRLWNDSKLGIPLRRRRFAGAERGSRVSQSAVNVLCERVRAPEHAPRGPSSVLERRHGLAESVERGVGVPVERLRVPLLHGHDVINGGLRRLLAEHALREGIWYYHGDPGRDGLRLHHRVPVGSTVLEDDGDGLRTPPGARGGAGQLI